MATGRIHRKARRGVALAVLGWLGVAVAAVLLAPTASAAPSATVEIRNVTPPAASVDAGGTVTFVNKIPPQNRGGVTIPLVGSFSATVYTDVSVTFFGQRKPLKLNESAAWKFNDPATTGTIEYKYRIVPQAGLAASVANQVVEAVANGLPALPAPTPYVVQTIAPNVPNLPSVNLPELPQVNVPVPDPGGVLPTPENPVPQPPVDGPAPAPEGAPTQPDGYDGSPYQYEVDAPQQLIPANSAAAAAFDPSRYFVPGESVGSADRAGAGGGGGAGGQPGTYDGASVPLFGQLAGLDDPTLDEQAATDDAAGAGRAPTLPIAALVAVVALATVFAALIRTHQVARAARSSR